MAITALNLPGAAAGAYRNTGSQGTPTWTEATSVMEVTGFQTQWEYNDASIRATRAKLYGKGQVEIGGTLKVRASPAAADYAAFFAAAQSPTSSIDMLILNGDIATEGCFGVRASFGFSVQDENQTMGETIYDTFELRPDPDATTNPPKSVVMAGSSTPTMTSL